MLPGTSLVLRGVSTHGQTDVLTYLPAIAHLSYIYLIVKYYIHRLLRQLLKPDQLRLKLQRELTSKMLTHVFTYILQFIKTVF